MVSSTYLGISRSGSNHDRRLSGFSFACEGPDKLDLLRDEDQREFPDRRSPKPDRKQS
jgi:hypothetical protein